MGSEVGSFVGFSGLEDGVIGGKGGRTKGKVLWENREWGGKEAR